MSNGTPTSATSRSSAMSWARVRMNVAMPANRGTRAASTGVYLGSDMDRLPRSRGIGGAQMGPAIDDKQMPRDRGRLAGKPGHRVGDLFRLHLALQSGVVADAAAERLEPLRVERAPVPASIDEAETDGIDADRRGKRPRKRERQRVERALGGAIGHRRPDPGYPGMGRDVHDRGDGRRLQVRMGGPGHQPGTGHVDGEDV